MTLTYSALNAQDISSKGKEFWLGFMDHSHGTGAKMDLYITSDSATTGTVYIDGAIWSTTFSITADSTTLIPVPSNIAHVPCSDCIQDKGIRIVTAKPVAVYAHIHRNFRSDATLVLPTEATGKTYRVATWNQETNSTGSERHRSQFMIIATSDNTKINITPTDNVVKASGTHPPDVKYSITLDKGEVYQGQAPGRNDDLTGTLIEVIDTGADASCKKIAVFSGNSATSLGPCPGGLQSSDNLYEQLYPVSSWGKDFLMVPTKTRAYDYVRIIAHQDKTAVIMNGNFVALLDAGQFYSSNQLSSPQYIQTTKPTTIAQFQTMQRCGGSSGDPAMTIISPIQQTLKDVVVYSSEYEAITRNYINVMMKSSDTSTFTIDGKKVPFTPFISAPFYAYSQITVNKGFQHLKSKGDGFVAMAYGMGNYESYGYAAGANVKNLSAYIDLANNKVKSKVINTLCLGEEAEFKGNANYEVKKWEWFFGDGDTSNAQNPNHTYKDTGTFKVKMQVTKKTSDGCSAVDSSFMEVDVKNYPKVSFGFNNVCLGDTVSFLDTVTTDPPGTIALKLWDFGDGVRQFVDNPAHLYDTVGKYVAKLLVRNSYECAVTITDTVEIYPHPVAKFFASKPCYKDKVMLQDSSIANPYPINKWIWNMGEGSIDTTYVNKHEFQYDTSGNFLIQLTVETEKGCTAQSDTLFKKHPLFEAGFSKHDACINNAVLLDDTSNTSGIAPLSRKWILDDGNEATTKSVNHTYANPGNYNIKLIITQNSECADSLTQGLEIFNQASPQFTVSDLCLNDSSILTASHTPNTETVDSFIWDYNGSTINNSPWKYRFADSGKQNFRLTSITDNGCKTFLDTFIWINPKPNAQFTSSVVCEGNEVTLINTSKDYGKRFTKVDWINTTTSSIGNPNTFKYVLGNKLYENVLLIVESGDGCSDTVTRNLKIWRSPKISISAADACLNDNVLFTNTTTVDSSTVSNWNWVISDGKTNTDSLPIESFTIAGTKKAVLTATTDKGCITKDSAYFNINPNPAPNFSVVEACVNNSTQFTSTSTIASGTIAQYAYEFGDGSSSASATASNTYTSAGNYIVKLVTESTSGCIDSIEKSVKAHAIPSADFTAVPLTGCSPLDVTFSDASVVLNDAINDWEWKDNTGVFSTAQSPTKQYTVAGKQSITLKVKSGFGCEDETQKLDYIEIYPKPVARFSYAPTKPTIIEPDVTFTDLSIGAITWDWDFGDGSNSTDQNPTYTFKDTGLFTVRLEITNANQCKNDTQLMVFVEPAFSVTIPNAFSPNGDGLNDVWGPVGVLQGVKGYELLIFNRWGEILFQTKDVNATWDGTYMGDPVPEGFYQYNMRYTDYFVTKWINKRESVYLMR